MVTLWTTPCWASSAPADVKQDCTGAWWTRGVDKYPPTDPAAFASAARWVTDRWGSDMAALEVWNEPNWEDFFRSDDPVADYTRLLKATYPAVKQESPATQVLGGSILMADRPFLEGMYGAGARGSFDAISMHAYSFNRGPYDPYDPYAAKYGPKYSYANGPPAMREAMAGAGDADKNIWLTEIGWSSCYPGTNFWCVTQDEQARYVGDAYRMIRERWPWVQGAFVYNLRNTGTDPQGRESQMGLVHADFTAKPSYASFATRARRPEPPAPAGAGSARGRAAAGAAAGPRGARPGGVRRTRSEPAGGVPARPGARRGRAGVEPRGRHPAAHRLAQGGPQGVGRMAPVRARDDRSAARTPSAGPDGPRALRRGVAGAARGEALPPERARPPEGHARGCPAGFGPRAAAHARRAARSRRLPGPRVGDGRGRQPFAGHRCPLRRCGVSSALSGSAVVQLDAGDASHRCPARRP